MPPGGTNRRPPCRQARSDARKSRPIDRDDPVRAPSCQPPDHGRRPPLSRQRGLQPRRGQGWRRHGAPAPRRGHAGHLPPPGRAQPRRRSRTGASTTGPLLEAQPDLNPEEIWGCEDPRLTWLPSSGLGDHLHGLQPPRAPGLAGDDRGLRRRPPHGPGHAAGGQGRRDLPAPLRRPLGDAPPAVAAAWQRPHLDLLLTGPPPLGRPRPAARGAGRGVVGRRQDRPRAAAARDARGLAALLPRRPRDVVRARSTASGWRCSTSRTRASSSTARTSGSWGRPPRTRSTAT